MSESEEEKSGGGGSKKNQENGLSRPPAVYISRFYLPEYLASGPEYPDSPKNPGPGPETPAPPASEKIWHTLSLI